MVVIGKMGTAFSNYIKDSEDFKLSYGIDRENSYLFSSIVTKPDVIIDFSTPSSTFMALNYAVENLVPIVIATTGFSKEQENKIKEYSCAIPIFKSSNMSYCISIFSDIAAYISKKLPEVDIEIIEKHHKSKKDAPSGTAIMISNNINKNCQNKRQINICSVRGGNLVGEHSVMFLGKSESIEITHTAYSRDIFVEGTLYAAKFIIQKKNGLYSMENLI